jgi:hypothetical protein
VGLHTDNEAPIEHHGLGRKIGWWASNTSAVLTMHLQDMNEEVEVTYLHTPRPIGKARMWFTNDTNPNAATRFPKRGKEITLDGHWDEQSSQLFLQLIVLPKTFTRSAAGRIHLHLQSNRSRLAIGSSSTDTSHVRSIRSICLTNATCS